MWLAAIFIFGVPVLLAVLGIVLLALGIGDVRRPDAGSQRIAGILRLVGGGGAILIAVLGALAACGIHVPYLIVAAPFAALALGLTWIAAWTIAAGVVAARR